MNNGGRTFFLVYLFFVLMLPIPGIVLEIMARASTRKPLFAGFRQLVGKSWSAGFFPFIVNWIRLALIFAQIINLHIQARVRS